jgi:hypothetical protein
MKFRILYFVMGVAATLAAVSILMLWHEYHEFRLPEKVNEMVVKMTESAELLPEDLTGKWHGKESWGATYTITRKRDGTFTEVYDTTDADVHNHPAITIYSGCWSLQRGWSGNGDENTYYYTFYYTKSSTPFSGEHRPWVYILTPDSKTEFTYMEEEGNGVREKKEK